LRLLSDLKFYVSEGWLNFKRSGGTTAVSVFIISISIAIITIFLTFFINIDRYLAHLKTHPVVSIYLKDNVSKSDIALLKNRLSLLNGVEDVMFIPKERGLKILYNRFPYLKGSDRELDFNPVPDTFLVKTDSKHIDTLKTFLQKYSDIVEEVYTPYFLLSKFKKVSSFFSVFASVLTLILIISSVITIYNVIRITVVSRKEDIAIMQLVGANMRYIRMPFVFEGIFQGIAGGIIGLLIGNLSVYNLYHSYLSGLNVSLFLKGFTLLSYGLQVKIVFLSVIFGVIGALMAAMQIEYT